MPSKNSQSPYYGSGQLTREQFLFYEMRITARLMSEGLSEKEIMQKVYDENLFQYPTERMTRRMVSTCMKRLQCLGDESLVEAIANQPSDVAKQICLYAMMKRYRLVWDFMVTVIGGKYRLQDLHFNKSEILTFFMQLQEQDELVASWSESTLKKIRSVLVNLLVENGYLDNNRSTRLNPVWLNPLLENAIKCNGDEQALPAFNCFS